MNLESRVLRSWISDPYLTARRVHSLAESAAAKPFDRYLILDDFFRTDAIDRLRDYCLSNVQFNDDIDQKSVSGHRVPYDSSCRFADSTDIGWDLFSDPEWHLYCAELVGLKTVLHRQVVKLRRHRPDANGFWIHTDSIPGHRSITAIAYFNEGWSVQDGGLLQIWREDVLSAPGVPTIEAPDPDKPLNFLHGETRIRTHTPGGKSLNRQARDFVLVDQVVPEYNRLFLCNLQTSPAWHSVTPSRGRPRYGFVQWIA
jgi:hypothetical protein